MGYINREDAGKRLAKALRHFKSKDTVVLALPRGGIVIGAEVARELKAPLGLVLVRKIGHPTYPEYAIGAVAEDGKPVYNEAEAAMVNGVWLTRAEDSARELVEQRSHMYYGKDFVPPDVGNKVVLIVDDGIATGLTMQSAVKAVKNKHAKRIVVGVPIAPQDSIDKLETMADEVVVLDNPKNFLGAVGSHYLEFDQVDDEEVVELLREVRDDLRQSVTAST